MTSERLIESKPSHTAKIVCYMRALAYREYGPPVARDHLAAQFLSPKIRAMVADDAQRASLLNLPDFQPANLSYLTARTRHLDRVFEEALADGVAQIVFLGAGYDSRSYRLGQDATNVQIFEVDAPTTQAAKRKYLDLAQIAVPPHVTFVSINFNYERLEDVLKAAGYDAGKRTLFVWEGVTYYISAEAVTDTLNFIWENSAENSIVAFDYIYEPMTRQQFNYHGGKEAYDVVAAAGEPFIYGIPEGEIEAFLAAHRFSLLKHYTPDEFQARYLDDRFDPLYGFMVNAVAQVTRAS